MRIINSGKKKLAVLTKTGYHPRYDPLMWLTLATTRAYAQAAAMVMQIVSRDKFLWIVGCVTEIQRSKLIITRFMMDEVPQMMS